MFGGNAAVDTCASLRVFVLVLGSGITVNVCIA